MKRFVALADVAIETRFDRWMNTPAPPSPNPFSVLQRTLARGDAVHDESGVLRWDHH